MLEVLGNFSRVTTRPGHQPVAGIVPLTGPLDTFLEGHSLLLSASMGSMLDALQADTPRKMTQTATPIDMAAGTYMILAVWKKYAVVPIIASTTVYPIATLQIPPIPAPRSPRMNASYRNIRRTSPRSVPIESRIPISSIRSLTDIIITLKILTAATRREIPPIAMMNVVTVLKADVSVASGEVASLILTAWGFRLGVNLCVNCIFYIAYVVDIVNYDIHLGPLIFPAILVSVPLTAHNDPVVR